MMDPKEPNKASMRAFVVSAALAAVPSPSVAEIDAAGGGVDGPLPSETGIAVLQAAFGAGGGVDGG